MCIRDSIVTRWLILQKARRHTAWVLRLLVGARFQALFHSCLLYTSFPELAEKFRQVGAIEKHHEERYRALLHKVETAQVFEKSEVKVWELSLIHI